MRTWYNLIYSSTFNNHFTLRLMVSANMSNSHIEDNHGNAEHTNSANKMKCV